MNDLFLNEYGRLRSGWRVIAFLLTFVIFSLGAATFSAVLLAELDLGHAAAYYLPFVAGFGISTVIAILLGWLSGRYLDGVPYRALGLWTTRHWYVNLLTGLLIGASAFATVMLILLFSGRFHILLNRTSEPAAIEASSALTLGIFLIGALSEETLFRGYVLQTLSRAKATVVGVLVTSFLFAVAHNGNPDSGWLSWLNTLLAGIWFAMAYLKTRDLWFPIGMHLMWNWLQGPFFGINVSGLAEFSPDPVFKTTDAGPAWLTGGIYGVEGGLACTVAIVIFIVVIWILPFPTPDPELLALTSEETPA